MFVENAPWGKRIKGIIDIGAPAVGEQRNSKSITAIR
jgi:hypothetical protein